MPPKGRSSSSHSSRSSGSRSSSSRSSSSRSSSSRSSSSRSSSSHSSSSRSSFSGRSSGPSRHSSTSHSSRSLNRGGPSRIVRANRPRINQPTGFHSSGGYRPTYYYGMNHDYVFFPVAWTDDATGTYYEKGYYDENGQRYDSVAFANNGRYENVVCHCAYCGQDTIMNPSSAEISAKKLDCPNCGAPMEIRSMLDQYQSVGNAAATISARPVRSGGKKILGIVLLVIVLIFAGLIALGSYVIHKEARQGIQEAVEQPVESFQLTGGNEDIEDLLLQDTIYLSGSDESGYTLSSSPADKELVWDDEAESFYDEDSDCWLWYNTDVEPPVWQYWYEGISSDFGDYGWMEHDSDGWFIEASYGNWIRLPEEYDTGSLWYMEE